MDNQPNQSVETVKQFGVQRKLLKAFGDLPKVLESRNQLEPLRKLADEEFMSVIAQILELPSEAPNWAHNIATLIGTARAHRSYREIFTIKEK